MADLIVRNLEEEVVQRLREEAVREGVSAEEAHRRLLRRALLKDSDGERMTIKEYLLTMPDFPDEYEQFFERQRGENRPVDL